MRLDRYLSERTEYSRSRIKELIVAKKVLVNGAFALKANVNITESDVVEIAGKPVRQNKNIALLLNKPAGFVSATEDKTEKTVTDLLPPEYRGQGLAPAGRLDKDTEGFLILTNDGDLLHELTSPKKHIPKYYTAELAREFTEEARRLIAEGITLKDGTKCLPARAEAIDYEGRKILICLHEGKYHQVKRMLAATGNHVEKLRRIAMGNMTLPEDLAPGEVTVLLNKDLCEVLKAEDIFLPLLQSLGKCSS